MAEIASAYVSLLPSASGFGKKLDSQISGEVSSSGKKAGTSFGKVFAAAGGAFAAVGVGSILKNAIGGAGELQQSIGAIDTVFDGSAQKMHKWGKNAALNVGLTRNEFNELGTLIGSQLKNGGTAMDQLAPKTKNLIGLGADLSSMFGGNTKEAVEALSSALKGERDPIERYGVSLNQAKIDSEAAALGFKKVDGALSDQAKQAATLSLIMKQTADAQGNFAKESNTLSGQQQRLSAQWGNLTTNLGTLLVPALTTVTGKFSGFLTEMQKGTGFGGQFVDVVTTIKNNLGTIAPALGVVVGGLAAYRVASLAAAAATAIQAAGTAGATGATWSLNAALRANPIGLVVTGLTALGVGLVVAYKKSETFRKIVNDLWGAIKVAGTWVGKIAGQLAGVLVGAFSTVSGMTRTFIGALGALGGAIVSRVQDVGQFVTGLKAKFGEAVEFVKGLPEKITGALGNAGTMLLDTGKNIISGLVNGIRSMAGELVATIKSYVLDKIPGPIKKFLGIASPSKVMHGIGQNIGRGLVNGIGAMSGKVGNAAEKMGQKVLDKLKSKLDGLKQQFASVRDGIASALMPSDLFSGTLADLSAGLSGWGNTVASIGASVKNLLGQGVGGKFLEQLVASGNAGLLAEVAASGQGAALASQFEASMAGVQGVGTLVAGEQFNQGMVDVRDEIRALRQDLAANAVATGAAVGGALNGASANAQRQKKNRRGRR